MQPGQPLYPPTPTGVPSAITAARPAYKAEVGKTMTAVVLFFIVYILMVVLSVGLSIACVYGGIGLMAVTRHWLGVLAGLGIISIGIMVFIFLVKFIFSVKKFDESKTIRITEDDQPELFSFIRQLTTDTQTKFPKKIVLSADVNACVYYNDSFWSMFFPVRKNLQIGLGLVNTLTLSEFKAVMAHEFGHFSQRSMKLGSFVYNVNKVIYNMLYENKDYGNFLSGWGSLHWAISVFVYITVEIVKGIQKVLEGMYALINKSYMRLSREMEFHADAVAASVSGSNNCISALKKIELSDMCFTTVMNKADQYLQQKEVLDNLYSKHCIVMKQYALEHNLPLSNHVPLMTDAFLKRFQLGKVNVQNQWASHPSISDRVERLNSLPVMATEDNRSAWELFHNREQLQQQLTAVVYNHLPESVRQHRVSENEFANRYIAEVDTYRLPAAYNGYYDNRQMNEMDMEKIFATISAMPLCKETMLVLFNDEKVAKPRQLEALRSDVQLVQAIMDKQVDVKTFDYDGDKYSRTDAPLVLEKINARIDGLTREVQQDEEDNAAFFYTAAARDGAVTAAQLKQMYITHFTHRKKVEELIQLYGRVNGLMTPLFQGQVVTIQAANIMADDLQQETIRLKAQLRYFFENEMIQEAEAVTTARQFLDASYTYFRNDTFQDADLSSLRKTLEATFKETGNFQLRRFKELLQFQLSLVE